MSGHKKTPAKPAVHSQVVVGSGKRRGLTSGLHAKLLLLVLASLIIAAGAALLIIKLVHPATVKTQSSKTTTAAATPQTPQELAYSGQATAASAAYDTAIAKATTTNEKVALYQSEITAALNTKQYAVVLKNAPKLLALQESSFALAAEAAAYEGQGNKAQAIVYYQKAADFITKNSDGNSNAGSNMYLDKVTQLSGEK